MISTAVVVGVAILAAILAVIVARVGWQRAQRNQIYESTMRLGFDVPNDGESPRFDELLAVVERSVRELRAEMLQAEAVGARLQAALDALPIAVMVFDGDGAVIEANLAATPFLEARHGDALVGAAVSELIGVSNAGEAASTPVELFGPPRRTLVVSTVPLSVDSQHGSVAFVEDITERKQLEAIRTDLVANISHELKTPVGAIGLLAETLQGEDDRVIVERLAGRINSEAMRIAQIIEDLIELSRIESISDNTPVVVDLVDLAAEAVDRHRMAAARGQVTVEVVGASGECSIVGDRRQLLSAIGNLVDNAIKYSDPSTSVEVSVRASDSEVILSVSDHGIGIPVRDIDRIFERFYRVDQARSRQTGGTGLGLAIVRHAALNHDARLDVESRLGEGSTFILTFARALDGTVPLPTDATVLSQRT